MIANRSLRHIAAGGRCSQIIEVPKYKINILKAKCHYIGDDLGKFRASCVESYKNGGVMKLISALLFCASVATYSTAIAQESEAVGKAQEAALHWLALADSGQYPLTWEQAAEPFQKAITQSDWVRALQSARLPIGAMKKRILKSATFKKTLPGAPDGEYVVIQYRSEFADKKEAIETVTPMLGKDGTWRVSGYFIK